VRSSPLPSRRRLPLAALGGTLALTATLTAAPAAADHKAFPSRVTLMGSLQSELGCKTDWDTACTATDLTGVPRTRSFELVTQVPAGSYEFKVRLNGSWDESYGLDGTGDNAPLVLPTATRLRFLYDGETHRLTVTPAAAPAATDPEDRKLAQTSLREELTRERFYFVMADRFENGDPTNDLGGYPDVKEQSGFDPAARGWYHGGDLKGILDRLDYIEQMGTTAIWLTPSFKNKPVQGEGADQSAGYHGYWITDFTQIDPHLGTNEELEQLIDEAHERGMKVFFDIITNHTADVIAYEENASAYISKAEQPYKDADGEVFDDREVAGTAAFPPLDPEVSFPYTPVFPTAADATVKVPSWLNDRTLYHNRGNAKFDGGESDEYGDFVGLDDLFTEHPTVVKGMEDIYKAWVDFGIDGFRIDTVKHVNMEFWKSFAPAIERHADEIGNDDFFSFGEVYDINPAKTSSYTTEGGLQATLDFGFQNAATQFAQGRRTSVLQRFFASDDWYTDADGNAYSLPTFLGNHDMGRIGLFLKQADPAIGGDELLDRDQLAHSLMYLTRGQPVVYYGDEQGFVGDGGDQLARQDMFPSKVAEYNDDDLIGTSATTAQSNFNTTHPLYRHLRELSQLRDRHPTLADGAQVDRYADDEAGVYAFSRIADADDIEYVVAANNSEQPQTVTVDTFSAGNRPFRSVWPLATRPVRTNAEGQLQITVPALSAVVYRASRPVARETGPAPKPVFTAASGSTVGGRAEVAVEVPGDGFNQVTFAYRPVGTRTWTELGTDDNAPYRVFHDVRALPKGTLLEYRAVVKDHSGNRAAAGTYAITGNPPVVEDVIPDPTSVSVPGTFNSEMGGGCADWQPNCPAADLTKDAGTGNWVGTFTLPAGTWEYKIAHDDTWDVNFGAEGKRNGGNLTLTSKGGPVTFTYDPKTHLVTTTEG
jgi:alpha-amylase